MVPNEFNPKSALQVTRTIYFALITGLIFFLIVTLTTIKGDTYFKLNFQDPVFFASLIMICLAIPIGYFQSQKLTKQVFTDSFAKKYPVYQTGLIIRMATCEGSGLFAVVGLLISNNYAFLVFFFIALFVMIIYFPSPSKIGQELDLTQSEIDSFTQ